MSQADLIISRGALWHIYQATFCPFGRHYPTRNQPAPPVPVPWTMPSGGPAAKSDAAQEDPRAVLDRLEQEDAEHEQPGVSIEQIQADSEKAAVASEQVLKESNPGELATQWRASDPLQAEKKQ